MARFSNDDGTLLALGAVALAAIGGAVIQRRGSSGRRYETHEWVDFFTNDKTRAQTRVLAQQFSEATGQAYDAWSQTQPALAQSQVDEDEVAYRTYASIAGHGIGLWDGELFSFLPRKQGYRLGKALEQHMKADPRVRELGARLDDEISMDDAQATYQVRKEGQKIGVYDFDAREDAEYAAQKAGAQVYAVYDSGEPDERVADFSRRSIRGTRAFQYTAKAPPGSRARQQRGELACIVPPQLPATYQSLSDAALWDRVESGADVLGGLSFDQALIFEPRRVDALIHQTIGRCMRQIDGGMGAHMRKAAYVEAMKLIRDNHGGDAPLEALVSLQEETWEAALAMASRSGMWGPPGARQVLRQAFDRAIAPCYDAAVQIAEDASRRRRGHRDNVLWQDYADNLREQKTGLRHALAAALPGPVDRRRIGGRRRMLPWGQD